MFVHKVVLAFALAAVLAGTAGAPGCAPAPPAASPTPSLTPSPPPSPSPPPRPSGPSPAPSRSAQPISAISRGSGNEPAHYTVRDPRGQIEYDVRSIEVHYDRAADGTAVAAFTKPDVIFHAKTGRTMVATAPEAVAHDKDKSVVMTGGVHAKTDDGTILTCDTLVYDAKHGQIRGSGNVVLVNSKTNQSASGRSLVSDLDFEHLTLSGGK